MIILCAGMTDQGRVRPNNEDTWSTDPELGIFLVSDGMGGLASGEVASALVAARVPELLRERLPKEGKKTGEILRRTLIEVSEEIKRAGMENPADFGMGATAVAAALSGRTLFIAHVGDSRAYLLRGGELRLLTVDHSRAQELVDEGRLAPSETRGHPGRFQLTQCMGMDGRPEPAVTQVGLETGDRVLLSSDGLSDMIDDAEIRDVLAGARDVTEACRRLIKAANEAGGQDNITAVVLEAAEPEGE